MHITTWDPDVEGIETDSLRWKTSYRLITTIPRGLVVYLVEYLTSYIFFFMENIKIRNGNGNTASCDPGTVMSIYVITPWGRLKRYIKKKKKYCTQHVCGGGGGNNRHGWNRSRPGIALYRLVASAAATVCVFAPPLLFNEYLFNVIISFIFCFSVPIQ